MTQILRLNKKFYAKEALEAAAENFGHLFLIGIQEDGDQFVIHIKERNETLPNEDVGREFANHCLALMK
ncbi:hypothetical protein HY772_09990 [Candidatus Woesearchaeota archaeon]|nr:hypothetical protein [Candidatus Woesearchaeota archaeon]